MGQPDFIASQDGAVVKYDPKAHQPDPVPRPKALTRLQRATLYFKAVRYIGQLFKDVGFEPLTEARCTAFTMELGRFVLDVAVRKPDGWPVAIVTSYPGYVYDPEKIKARVTRMDLGADGEYFIQVGAVLPNGRSVLPVFVSIDRESADPLREAFVNVLMAARDMISRDPATLAKIQEALDRRDVQKDFERYCAADEQHQLEG